MSYSDEYYKALKKKRKELGKLDKSASSQQIVDPKAKKYSSPTLPNTSKSETEKSRDIFDKIYDSTLAAKRKAEEEAEEEDIAPFFSSATSKVKQWRDEKEEEILAGMTPVERAGYERVKKKVQSGEFKERHPVKDAFAMTGDVIMGGLASWNKGLTATADVLLGKPLQYFGWENNPVSKIADYYDKQEEIINQERLDYIQDRGYGDAVGGVSNFFTQAVSSVPDALLAIMTAGTSKAATATTLATNAASQAGGLLTKAGLTVSGMAKNPQFWLSFARTFGSDYEEAKANGANDITAAVASTFTSLVNAGIEIGPDGLSGIQGLSQELAEEGGSKLLKWAVSSVEEGGEEVLQGFVSDAIARVAYDDEREILNGKKMLQEFAMGAGVGGVLGGGQIVAQSAGNYVGNAIQEHEANKLTENEQKVVDKLVQDRIAEAKENGETLTKKAAEKQVRNELEKGYISTDTIEEVLGGDSYTAYKDNSDKLDSLQAEYDELYKMKNGDKSDEQIDRQAELKQQLDELKQTFDRTSAKTKLNDEVFEMVKGDRLAESYNELARRHQSYQADLSKYDKKQQAVIQKAIDSGVLNNSNRTHEFVDMVAKISADKGVLFDFTNNQKLRESGFAMDGVVRNGFVSKDGVTLNVQAAKSLNKVVGHEITHVLEGTELYNTLQETVFEYAKSKGEYDSRLEAITALYKKNDPDADPVKELTADLVGDYLFTDTEFINNLSTNHRNVFQKVYDEIKYLCKVATAGSKEARQLEKVKKAFEDAYRNSEAEANEATDAEVDDVQNSISVTDQETLDTLNDQVAKGEYDAETNPDGGYYVTYKSMSFWGYDENGNAILRSPMAEYVDGELSNAYLIPKDKSKLNWYQATETLDEQTGLPSGLLVKVKKPGNKSFSYLPAAENQDLIKDDWSNLYFNLKKKVLKNGKWVDSDVPARYNPYEHSSNSMLNDQFSTAYLRDNLVTVKMYVPVSEDNGAFRAKWSKDPTGWADWKTGTVAGKINKQKDLQRRVYLSRYAAPVEIVSDSEVAQAYKSYIEGTDVTIPDNVVSPGLLAELKKAGVPITESGKVKYSLSADSEGNKLSDGQKEYFSNSKIVDANGNLLKVYHGTTNKFTTFRQGKADGWGTGIYFTDNRAEASTYGDNVVEAYLNIQNPYNADTMNYYDIGAENTKAYRDFDMEVWKKSYDEYDTYEEYKADGQGVDMYDIYSENVEVFNKILRELGYDGIIADGSNGIDGLEIVAFNENQPKLTTNTKPTTNKDIRYSLSDSEGNKLSNEQAEYFKDSKARDKNGNLLKVYHTTNSDFTVFDKSKKGETTGDANTYLGFFFADEPEYMAQFPEFKNGKTEAYYLNMTNPIDMNNISRQAFIDIVEATGGDIQEAAELYDSEYADELKRAKFRGDNSPIMDMSRLLEELTGDYFDYAEFYNALKPNYDQLMSKGYDGIINSLDGRGWANEYIVLDSNQAKLASNTNPSADPDIRFSLSEDTSMSDNAIAKNADLGFVTGDVMDSAKALREYVANRLRGMKENGVAIPDDVKGSTAIANSSYDITEENTTICPRSLASEAFTDAVSEYLGRPLTVDEQIYISQDLQNRSLTPECVYCYVATDRKAYRAFLGEYVKQRDSVIQKLVDNPNANTSRSGDLYKEFLNGRKDTEPMYKRFKMWVDSYKNGTPMIDASHLANINKLMGDINEFGTELKPQIVDAMKYAQSASWAKKRVSYVSYDGHILKWKQNRIDKLNSHYGLRMYSFSDFHPAFVLENMQMITDASVRGLKMLGYTKDIDFVDIFAPTGMNINVSTFGFESGGNVYENNIIGAEWEKAKALREQYPNVGVTFVATNDTLVDWALKQDWIDVVIPYHLVRTGAEVAKAFNFHNYTDESSDVKDVGWDKGTDKKYIAPTEHNNDKATYLAALAKNHLKPRFERFLGDPNYMKLVNECRQPASESQPVQPKFGEEAIDRTLAKLQANGYYQPIGGSVDRMYEIAAEVAENMIAPTQHSLSNLGEADTPTGKYNVYGKDIALPSALTEDIAPVAEESTVSEQTISKTETVAEELFPDNLSPIDQEIEKLAQQFVELESRLYEMTEAGQFDEEFNRISEEWSAVKARLEALEQEAATEDADRISSLDDSDAPPEAAPLYDERSDVIPITKKLENDIARDVRASLALRNKHMADVHSIIQKYSNSEFPSRDQLFHELKDKFSTYTESFTDDSVVEAKKYLRTYGLHVGDYIQREIADFATVKKQNRYKIKFSDDGTPVDVLYAELNSMYPHLFPESIDVPTDQFMQMVEVANMDNDLLSEQEIPDESIMEVADTIIHSVSQYRQIQKEKAANKSSREAFGSLLKDADKHIPQFTQEAYRRLSERPNVIEPDDIAPTYDIETDVRSEVEGQQAFLPDAGVAEPVTRKNLHQGIIDRIKDQFHVRGYELDDVLKNAKNLSTFATVDNTPQRVMEKALGYKEGQILSDITVNKVAQNETEGIKWLNSFTDRKNGLLAKISNQYHIKPGSKESAAAQMYAEGFYVTENNDIVAYGDAELAKDFKDAVTRARIKNLAKDPRIRQIYDETLAAINESRARNAYPEIPRLDNYFLHFRAMEDTFSRLGLPFNPNDIRAKDLPTDLNGVTADLKPGQPYFASAMHRTGKRTSFDLLGGLEKYLTSAKNQIYHIDDIQTLRALRNYVADTYGQANGLEGLDALSEEEAQDRIEKVYNSHLSTFAKFLNEEANILAGKTALIDRGLEGIIGRRGITFLDTVNKQVGSNMVGFNVSSSLTNILPVMQTFAKTNKVDFVRAFGQTVANKVGSIFGRSDGFTDNSPVVIRRKGAERFYRTPFQKVGDAGYVFMSLVDDTATELIARTKYNELTRKGMDSQQAHYETDKWVSRLMGDRSLGQQPQLYNSKMLGLVTKFQLEVRNQLDSQFYDTIQEAKVSNEEIQNGLIRNAKTAAKVAVTFAELAIVQHVFGKAFESIAGYNPAFDIIEVMIKTFGLDDEEEDEDTVLDNVEEGFLALLEDLPYTSTLTGGRIPISSALPITELIKGQDQYGNDKSRWETLGEIAPYYMLPGGYGQAKKTMQGLSMFSEDHPIAGSYTDNGDLRFPVDDTLANRVQAGLFGQWSSENARKYFDQGRKPLNEKQTQEFIDVEMPIQDYWNYRDGLKGLSKVSEQADYINSLDIPTWKKNLLINNLTDRKEAIDMTDYGKYGSFEEFDFAEKNPEKYNFFKQNGISYTDYASADEDLKRTYTWAYDNPEKYQFVKNNGVSIEDYSRFNDEQKDAYTWAYKNPEKFTLSKAVTSDLFEYRQYTGDLYDIRADKDENGKSISGSAKEKKLDYINSLDIDYGAKCILFKDAYPADDTYNYDIIDYLNSRDDISYEEMNTILKELGFTIEADGVTITWD